MQPNVYVKVQSMTVDEFEQATDSLVRLLLEICAECREEEQVATYEESGNGA